jgi:tartrate-resistant acid phosphatase type 5
MWNIILIIWTLTVSRGSSTSFPGDPELLEADNSKIRFVTIGDSGNLGPDLTQTGERMRKVIMKTPISFVSLVGDLCYPDGFISGDDPRFPDLIEATFHGLESPVYPVLGDNDYGGEEYVADLSAYLSFGQHLSNWRMPSFFYHSVHEVEDLRLCSIHIDTQSLVEIRYPEARSQNDIETLNSQMPWLERVLGSPECHQSDFIVIFGHHPLLSASRKGNKGTTSKTLREKLIPLFYKYHVDAYFSGHDHDLQALNIEELGDDSISFIVSGSSSRLRKKTFDGPLDGIKSWRVVDTIGFTLTGVTKEKMTTYFISSETGDVIHSHVTMSHRHLREERVTLDSA